MRVHELAKELGMTSKDLMARIAELGGSVKSHMAIVDVELLTLLQGKLTRRSSRPRKMKKVRPRGKPKRRSSPKSLLPNPVKLKQRQPRPCRRLRRQDLLLFLQQCRKNPKNLRSISR